MKVGLFTGERGLSRGQIMASYRYSADRHTSLTPKGQDDVNRLYAGLPYSRNHQRLLGMLARGIREDHRMNKDILASKWKQMQGQIKVAWGKLSDDDLDEVAGRYDKFVSLLQDKYGYTRERAEEAVDRLLREA
jgi:uncharacterized protein YjbJ (UPF0337 family)